jgi:hypothetical protein
MADKYEEKAASAGLSGAPKKKSKKGKKKVRSMRVKPAANGGYVAEHEMEHEPGEMGAGENPTHVIPEGGMDAHMTEHMPSPAGGAAEEETPAGEGGGGEGAAAAETEK